MAVQNKKLDPEGTTTSRGSVNREDAKRHIDEARYEQMEARRAAREVQKQEARTYIVQPGDSLSKIAEKLYGDASRWSEIFEANKDQLANPNMIRAGQELKIP
ncbi:MAG: LysM peptidoglycan-binding domain-containing protein [Anaerolineae bacterium]|nr:LysM peptidoglycan-binding domain-containing protein [Anaerolineae bacterium]